MLHLLDTNVLLRLIDTHDPQHTLARRTGRLLRNSGHELRSLPQNFAEFWNVSTRPRAQNGLGQPTVIALRMLSFVEHLAPVLPDATTAYEIWRRLIVAHGVRGKQVHDARIVAAMLAHGVSHIVTFNFADFHRYSPEGIVAVDPATV